MKHRLLYLFLLLGIVRAYAVPIYEYDAPVPLPFQSHKILNAGTVYSGTTYVPFDNSVPSDFTVVGAQNAANARSGHVRKGKILGPDTDPGQESPIGEPWVLLAFIALFAGIVAYRQHKSKVRGE